MEMTRRLRPIPHPKLEIERKANSEVTVRQMTEDELKREKKPSERDF